MAGQYQNNQELYITILSNWIENSIATKAWDDYKDLHLDEIDKTFKEPEYWFDGALYIYKLIHEILDDNLYNCLLVLTLSYSKKETNIKAINIKYIACSFDLTPPSFYIFPIGDKNYDETLSDLIHLEQISNLLKYKVFFKQEKMSSNEYSRALYIVKP